MGYELTGNSISSTYARLVQHVSDNYYDGAGNILGIVSDTSLQNYVAKAGDTMTGDLIVKADIDISDGAIYFDGLKAFKVENYGVRLGTNALEAATGLGNIGIGHWAGNGVTTGEYNVLIGPYAGMANTIGSYNVGIGYNTLKDNSSGSYNTAIGREALQLNLASNNTAYGYRALNRCTTGTSNVGIGNYAGYAITSGTYNMIIGPYAGQSLTSGNYNVAIGSTAMRYTTTGGYNVAIGPAALRENTTSGYQIAIGGFALMNNTTGSGNAALGYSALYANTTGNFNTGIGYRALAGNKTGSHNIGIGFDTGYYDTDGSLADNLNNCFYIGNYIKSTSTNAINEIAIGHQAVANGNNSITLGNNSITKTILKGNIGIGTTDPTAALDVRGNANIDGSLYINSGGVTVKGNTTNDRLVVDTGLNFTPVARPAASSIDVSVLAVPGNIDAGLHSYSYSFVTPLGETELMNSAPVGEYTFDASNGQALLTVPVSTDYRVTARKIYRSAADVYKYTVYHIATIADNTTTTYIDNLPDSTLSGAPGYYRPNTTSEQLKYNGLTMGMVGDFITLFGRNAGAAMIAGGGYMNTLIGPNAGATITTGSMNTAIGYNALSKLVTGSGGVAIGEMAGYNVTGSNNVIIGNYAFNGMSGAISGASNVVIGARAGYSASGSAANNVMLGQYSGYNTTGNYNLYLGYYAGYRTTGSNNIIIDTIARANASTEKTDAPIFGETSATRANQRLYLGGGGKVGINTITPTTTLDVSGSFNVNGNIYVDGSVGFTGDVSVGQTMRFKNGILIQVL